MANALFRTRMPANEPVLSYAPGTPERRELSEAVRRVGSRTIEIPLVVGGKKVKTGRLSDCRAPHDHAHLLGRYHKAGKKEVQQAIDAAAKAWPQWSRMDWHDRASIFLKAAELLAGPYRQIVNAATTPIAAPLRISHSDSLSTMRTTRPGSAPSAIRTPISLVRRTTL